MTTDVSLEGARHEVLAENTAQAVHKHLSKLFQEAARFRSRWVWELLQNARDASPEEGVSISLTQLNDRLIFRHNGMPFTQKGVAHLIYHGSTKYDFSGPSLIGQFGTGFLTTHLISKTVMVKGIMDDGRHFEFLLDRRGEDADHLKAAMNASWVAFTKSLVEPAVNEANGLSTEYEYPLASGSVSDVVAEGIADLITNASYLLAFNDKIRSVKVEQPDRSVIVEKIACQQINEIAQCFNIREQSPINDLSSRYVAVIVNDGTSVAVEIAKDGASWSVSEQGHVPRIFVAFPLTGTRDFCLPIVINNDKLQPREERDTLFLGPNSEGMQNQNMIYMEHAFDLGAQLVMLGTADGWGGAASLLKLSPLRQCDWIDENWLRTQIAERFISRLRAVEVLTTSFGGRIAPGTSMVPISDDSEICLDLWDIAMQIEEVSQQLPRRDEALIWVANLKSWAPFLSMSFEQLEESLTLEKVCEKVAIWGSVEEVRDRLSGSIDHLE
ncbi:hypothetical protein EG832_02350, partial [bacterium]|nr:hypothetical protein [bacterium]